MELKKNKSSIFILPIFENIQKRYLHNYLNCYIRNSTAPFNGIGTIIIAFEESSLEEATYNFKGNVVLNTERLRVFRDHEYFYEEEVIDDFVLFSFRVPDNFEEDLELFEEGKYSQFSGTLKRMIKNHYPGKKIESILNPTKEDIINKKRSLGVLDDSNVKITEIIAKPNMFEETFKVSNFLVVDL